MKIKYKNSDGTILAVGHMPNLQPGVDETVEDFNGNIPEGRLDFFKRTGLNTVIEKSQAEKDAILADEKKITSSKFMNKFNTDFPSATDVEKFLARSISKVITSIKEKDIN